MPFFISFFSTIQYVKDHLYCAWGRSRTVCLLARLPAVLPLNYPTHFLSRSGSPLPYSETMKNKKKELIEPTLVGTHRYAQCLCRLRLADALCFMLLIVGNSLFAFGFGVCAPGDVWVIIKDE